MDIGCENNGKRTRGAEVVREQAGSSCYIIGGRKRRKSGEGRQDKAGQGHDQRSIAEIDEI
jgi:hypothetical protein